ncbi:hypothetical protein SRHO_G00080280 [Serrasalmus rhombeus]
MVTYSPLQRRKARLLGSDSTAPHMFILVRSSDLNLTQSCTSGLITASRVYVSAQTKHARQRPSVEGSDKCPRAPSISVQRRISRGRLAPFSVCQEACSLTCALTRLLFNSKEMRRGEPLPQAFQAPVDVHASEDGQVYMFRSKQEDLDASSEDEELNIMELRPRNWDTSSQEQNSVGELLLLERKISHEDNLNKLALQYGCKVADIKRVNNLIKEQDLYALKSIRIPVKKHGLLTETNPELKDPQKRPSSPSPPLPDQLQNISGEGPSVRPQVQEYTDFLKEVDNDIERLIQNTEAQEEVFGGSSDGARRWGSRGKRLNGYGADWGIQWWNAVIAMLLIGIVLPIFYVVYFKTQDSGESAVDGGVTNGTLATSNNSGSSFSTATPNGLSRNHFNKP